MNENLYKKKKRRLELLLLIAIMVCSVFTVNAEMNTQHGGLASQRLGDFIKSLEKQYQVSFVYDASQINKESIIEADKNASPLERALKQLLSSGITYKIIDNKVILKKAELQTPQQAKDIVVRGTITIKTKTGTETTPGIYVLEKGTKNGTATGMNGEYSIRVKDGATLVFSMIGYKSQEVPVNGRTTINVTLQEDVNALEEVVVTGYQTIDRKLFTGAATTLKGSDVRRDGITDVSRMLEGRVAGVSVQNVSGTFGAAPKIRVRGASSITGDNKPLWVVDGVVLEDVVNISNEQLSTGDPSTLIGSSVAGLNPDDIESFQILKDAAATALYGARAMNGVVVITTKKGKIGKPIISYTGNFSTYQKPSYDNYNILNSADQMSVYLELERKGWLNFSDAARSDNGGVYTKMYDGIFYPNEDGTYDVENTSAGRAAFLNRYAKANTDWFGILFRNSLLQEHSLSVSSGTEKSQLYFSTSFLNDNGWTVADHVKRFTGNARANFNVTDKLTFGLIAAGSIRDQLAPGSISRQSNVVEGKYDRDFDINPFSYALNTSRTITPYDENGNLEYFRRNYADFNILNELENNTLDLSMIDLKLQGDLSYKVTKDLKYSFLGSLRYAKTNREHKVRENSNMPMAYRADEDATIRENNRFLYRDPDDPEAEPIVVLPYGGFYNTEDDNLVSYYLRNTLEWSKTFSNDHLVNLYGSQELRYADRQNKFNNGYGYQFDKGGVPYLDPNIIKRNVEGNLVYYGMQPTYDRFLAWMINGAYSYKSKYNFNGTIRYDGSNLLGKARSARWLPTWNVGASWNLDSEDFMKNQFLFSRLTLRSSYGLTASMGQATNSSLVLRSASAIRPYLNEIESVINLEDLENSELTWEKQYKLNIGIDAGLFKERLRATIDFYNHQSYDLISPLRTSAIGGQFTKIANYADMKSNGLEVTLGGSVIKEKNWEWNTQINGGYNKNEITSLRNNPNIWSLIIPEGGPLEGHPYRGLYSIDFVKFADQTGVPVFVNEKGEESINVYLQSDVTNYLRYEGAVDPTLTGGFYNSVRFRSLSLSALVTFSAGNKIRLNPVYKNSYSDLDALPNEFLDRWIAIGDGLYAPSISDKRNESDLDGAYPYTAFNYTHNRVADGGFVRLKQVALNYVFPLKWTRSIGASNASLGLVANNPWLIYSDKKLKGQDPEFFSSGGVALPIPKQYTLSFKIGF